MSSVQHVDGHQCHLVTPIAAVAAGLDERRTSYAFTTSSSPAKHLVDDSDVDGELLATGGATYRAACPPSVVSQLDLDGEPDLDTRGTRGSHATLNSTHAVWARLRPSGDLASAAECAILLRPWL